jgi:hypothetical protein
MLYILILLILFSASVNNDNRKLRYPNKKKNDALFIVFVMALLAGLSKEIGGDVTFTYWPEFSKSPTLDQLTSDYLTNPDAYEATNFKYQPLYVITRTVIRSFTDQFWIYHIFHALFINLVIYSFLKERTPYLCLALIFYLIINYLEYNTEIIRESLAVACGLVAFIQVEKKKFIWAVLWVIIAYMFHNSALILLFFPLALSLNYIPPKYILVFFLFLALIIPVIYERTDFSVVIALLDEDAAMMANYRLNQELDSSFNSNFFIVHYFRNIIFPAILIWLTRKDEKFQYIGFVYIYLLFHLLSMFGVMFYRFANYYAPFYWLFLAHTGWHISERYNKQMRGGVIFFFIATVFVLYAAKLFGGDDSGMGPHLYDRYFPYKSVLFDL